MLLNIKMIWTLAQCLPRRLPRCCHMCAVTVNGLGWLSWDTVWESSENLTEKRLFYILGQMRGQVILYPGRPCKHYIKKKDGEVCPVYVNKTGDMEFYKLEKSSLLTGQVR